MIADYVRECGLDGLTPVDGYKWVARCPMCGDSKKNRSKKRFYILLKQEQVYCHNCLYSNSIKYFLKYEYPEVYKMYISDLLKFNKSKTIKDMPDVPQDAIKKPIKTNNVLKIGKKYGLTFDVESIIFVKRYLEARNLNYKKFGYIKNFFGYFNEVINGEDYKDGDDPRIIIPFLKNDTKEIYALQGRAIYPKQEPKYLTMIFNEKYGKLYNYYNIDKSKKSFCTESPIDSMFLSNAMALSGANLNDEIISKIKELSDCTMILDRDMLYNFNINNTAKKIIKSGLKIFIPPDKMKVKDLNDLSVKECMSNQEIEQLIVDNTYSGLQAKVRLSLVTKKRDDILDV